MPGMKVSTDGYAGIPGAGKNELKSFSANIPDRDTAWPRSRRRHLSPQSQFALCYLSAEQVQKKGRARRKLMSSYGKLQIIFIMKLNINKIKVQKKRESYTMADNTCWIESIQFLWR